MTFNDYTSVEDQLIAINGQRDAIAAQMIGMLEGAEFNNQQINKDLARQLINQGQALLNQVNSLATGP
jgi:hypothetical protein